MSSSMHKKPLNKVSHSVRTAQAVLQYGVGAMVDFPDQTLMTASPEFWQESVIQIHDERFEKALGVSYFGMPTGKTLNGETEQSESQDGISYVRFPEWYFCPKCRKFQSISHWYKEYKKNATPKQLQKDPYMISHLKCTKCKLNLVVSRIVVVCESGHIDDFPWIKWVHRKNVKGSQPVCSNPQLVFEAGNSTSEGLEGLKVKCKTCNSIATLKGAFDPNVFERLDEQNQTNEYLCTGRHPHKNEKLRCLKYPKTMQRGASSVYFPVVLSSLVIPPYAEKLTESIEKSKAFEKCLDRINDEEPNDREAKIVKKLDDWSAEISNEIGFDNEQVKRILIRKWLFKEEDVLDANDLKYRIQEFDALSSKIHDSNALLGDFSLERYDINKYNIPQLQSVVLVNKIREVRALVGFSRISPATSSLESSPSFVSSKRKKMDWYPGYEVRGEGIFLEFKNELINAWVEKNLKQIKERIDMLSINYASSFIGQNNPRDISPKFVLLHTLAHLLIKQLSFECGYSIASLRERIYCSEVGEEREMAGIFIYTASGDSEGTLGGLVRQGRPNFLEKIFKKAIENAKTCSNDPVCILSNGQGRDSLNLATCHACALIPETGCEEYNVFLDRALVVGTFENRDFGYFS